MSVQIENVGGRLTKFGPETTESKFGRSQSRNSQETEVVWELTYDDIPLSAQENEMPALIPAGAHILEATVVALEAFDGTDGAAGSGFLTLGLAQPDGTAIDADGLAVIDALTEIDDVNETVVGAGALVGTAISENGQLVAALDGASSLTAGRAKVYVKYRAANADVAGVRDY